MPSRKLLSSCAAALVSCAASLPPALVSVAQAAPATPAAPAAPVVNAVDSASWGVDQLMSTLARRKSGRATFTETKYLSMLEKPVESSGELVFVAPDRLEKRTLKPKPENLVVEGDMVTVERGGKRFTMPLPNYPELAAFIDSLRGTLAGNRDVLERYYRLRLAGRASRWTLTLTPADSRMAAVVSEVRIDGSHDALDTVEIRQPDGDRSVMKIRAAGLPAPVSPAGPAAGKP